MASLDKETYEAILFLNAGLMNSGWKNIPKLAYLGCIGAKKKEIFEKYCLHGNCKDCLYNKNFAVNPAEHINQNG